MSHDVFISHSTKDKNAGDAVCAVLERNSIRCWIAPRDVTPGTVWGAAIVGAINEAKVIVLVFSGAANTSPQIEREVERAISKGIPIIPFRIEDVQPSESLEYFISASHWLDAFTEPLEQHLETLAKVVRRILEVKKGTDGAAATPARPIAPPAPTAAQPRPARWPLFALSAAVLVACIVIGILLLRPTGSVPPVSTAVSTSPSSAPVIAPKEPLLVAAPPPAAPATPPAAIPERPAAPQSAPPAAAPAAAPAAPQPEAPPAFTNQILKAEPPIGQLPTGAKVLVDDHTCPKGKIKQVIGGSLTTGQPRVRSCVPHP